MDTTASEADDVLLRTPEVCRTVGVGRTTLYRWEQQGSFPKRIRLGPRVSGWLRSDLRRWFEQRRQERTPEAAASRARTVADLIARKENESA